MLASGTRWSSGDDILLEAATLNASSLTDDGDDSGERQTPSERFPYRAELTSTRGLRRSSASAMANPAATATTSTSTRRTRLAEFLQLNAVQRCLSAAVLAPLVTFFIWLSPAVATATVCSFMMSACSYEYACIANRIQLRLLAHIDAFEHDAVVGTDAAATVTVTAADRGPRPSEQIESAVSPHSTRSNNSQRSERSSALRDRSSLQQQPHHTAIRSNSSFGSLPTPGAAAAPWTVETTRTSDCNLLQHQQQQQFTKCAVTRLAARCFGRRVWLAAVVVSVVLSAVASSLFLASVRLVPQLESTEFYASRVFYAVATSFVAGLCACFTPNWRFATISFLENAVFTILTMHSTICPINQFSCGLSVEPAQIFLGGAVVLLLFRSLTSSAGPHALIACLLDVLGFVYIIGTLSVVVAFVDDDKKTLYRKLLIALLYVVWASDTGAYLTGKTLAALHYTSRAPLAAHLSKNKDYEGTIGAITFGVAAMLLASSILQVPGAIVTKVAFTVVAVVIGRLGDLFESLLKRAAGVKDSGKLIPGHGGVLDRIDALMFAALVFARYYALVIGVKHDAEGDNSVR